MPKIKPFHFRLSKVSQKTIQMIEGLLEYLPAVGARENFHLSIRKALHQYLSEVGYYLERIEETAFKDFFAKMPSPCCVGVLGLEPFKQKAFIEIDPFLSHLIIEKLLGGKGENFGELRPLTETEQGVIEFLLLKLLAQIHKVSGEAAKLHFRLERMILEPSHIRSFGEEGDPLLCLKLHVALLKRSGFVNLYLPHPWVTEGFLKELPENPKTFGNLKLFLDQPCPVWGALGETQVSYRDLKSLEAGDVVLFDQSLLNHKKGEWKGEVTLRVGKGEACGLKASWDGFKEGGKIHLEEDLKAPPPVPSSKAIPPKAGGTGGGEGGHLS